jgi:hypothetical protein
VQLWLCGSCQFVKGKPLCEGCLATHTSCGGERSRLLNNPTCSQCAAEAICYCIGCSRLLCQQCDNVWRTEATCSTHERVQLADLAAVDPEVEGEKARHAPHALLRTH